MKRFLSLITNPKPFSIGTCSTDKRCSCKLLLELVALTKDAHVNFIGTCSTDKKHHEQCIKQTITKLLLELVPVHAYLIPYK
jgi:hypothetical protein